MRLGNVLIPVDSIDRAIDFYRLPVKFRDGDRFAALDGGSVTIALAGPSEHVTADVSPSFKVDDVPRAVREMVSRGAEVITEPQQGPHEVRAVLRDPAGNVFVLYSAL